MHFSLANEHLIKFFDLDYTDMSPSPVNSSALWLGRCRSCLPEGLAKAVVGVATDSWEPIHTRTEWILNEDFPD